MENKDHQSASTKRGPKPIGERPMTAAERKRMSRARKATAGRAEFMVSIAGETLAFVDEFAKHNGATRSEVIQEFLDMAIAKVRGTIATADKMLSEGASTEEIQTVMRAAFGPASLPDTSPKENE